MKKVSLIGFALFILSSFFVTANAQVISTIAGNGSTGFSGDGGPGTAASLGPYGVDVDRYGHMLIADNSNNVIRKLTTTGIISTIAGNDTAGFRGDGGPATLAEFFRPGSVAIDSTGNIYVADQLNDRIRKINTAGIISTFAGNGSGSFSGDGGQATAAALFRPCGVAVDSSGNVYIADQYNNRVRKVNTSGIISTLAGRGGSSFGGDGGPATNAYLNNPEGVSVDRYGNVYIADAYNNRIRKVNIAGTISTVAGSSTGGYAGDGGAATAARLNRPYHACMDGNSNLYIADEFNHRIRKVNTSGVINTFAGTAYGGFSGDGGPATAARLSYPTGIAIDAAGNVFVADLGNYRVRKIGPHAIVSASGSFSVCLGNTLALSDSTAGGTWLTSDSSLATIDSTGTLTSLSTGTVTITYLVPGAGSETASITVNPLPNPGYIIGSVAICSGSISNYIDSTLGGTWRNTDTTVGHIDSSTGTYYAYAVGIDTLVYAVTNTCGTALTFFPVSVSTVPSAPSAISGGVTLCAGASISLSSSPAGGTWLSASPSIATVAATGIVSGIATGTTIVSYVIANTCGIAASSLTINVSGSAPSIAPISLPATYVCSGSTLALSNATSGGVWSSSNASVATVDAATGIVTGVAGGSVTISYAVTNTCGTSYATAGLSVVAPPATPSAITGATSVCAGASITLSSASVGGYWASASSTVAVATGTGTIVGLTSGTALVTYTVSNSCGTASATTSIAVIAPPATPAAISGSSSLCVGGSATLSSATASGLWSSAVPGIATINSATGSVLGRSAGTVVISYAVSNACGSAFVTYAMSIIGPPSSPLPISGPTSACSHAATYFFDSTAGGTWSCSPTSAATINSATGLLTGVAAGTAFVTYTIYGSCGSTSVVDTVVIVAPPAVPAAISGPSAVCAGSTVTLSSATAGGTWSGSTSFAAVSPYSGLVTGITAGSTVLTYTVYNGCGSAYNTQSISIISTPSTPGPISGPAVLCLGVISPYTDTTSAGIWSTSNTAIATIDSFSGRATGIAVGSVVITYLVSNSCGSSYNTRAISVGTIPTVTGIIGGGIAACPGVAVSLFDSTHYGTWSSSNTAIAVVTAAGVVTGASSGVAFISYTVTNSCGSSSAFTSVTIHPLPFADSILGIDSVCAGRTIVLYDSTHGGGWTSSNLSIATVSSTGTVTGSPVSSGTVNIFYSVTNYCGTATVSKAIRVLPAAWAGSISGAMAICPGYSTLVREVVPDGVWTSSDTTIATVLPIARDSARVTGVSLGNIVLSYTVTNSCGTAVNGVNFTVRPFPRVAPISGPNVVCPRASIYLTDSVAEGAWRSDDISIAMVDDSGRVTGNAPGYVNIRYIVANNCGADTAKYPISVYPYSICAYPASIQPASETSDFSIVPNPSNGSFTIFVPQPSSESALAIITDVRGAVITRLNIMGGSREVNLNTPAGVYFVRVIVHNELFTRRIVIE